MLTLRRMAAALAVVLPGAVLGLSSVPASAGPAPDDAPDLELDLTAECAVGDTLYWRVTNDNDVPVEFTWEPAGGSPGTPLTATANSRTYFTSTAQDGPNTTIIRWVNPADGPDQNTKAHNNQQCVYHVQFEKTWNGSEAPDLDGGTLLTATSSLGTATCTSDDGALTCVYSTGEDLQVPFGETYSVAEPTTDGWDTTAGVGDGFTGIDGFDEGALPEDLVYVAATDRFCAPDPNAEFPFNLAKFCTHTVTNEFDQPDETTTTTAPPEAPATFEMTATPICVGDFPYVDYEITGDGVTDDSVELRFLFGGQPIQNLGTQPLTGRVLFPGASEDPRDWPGWREVPNSDGEEWEIDPTDAAWRTGVVLEATLNPTATVDVAYPDGPCQDPRNIGAGGPTQSTVPPTPTVPPGGGLPATGSSETGTMALIAFVFLAGGTALVGAARRRTAS